MMVVDQDGSPEWRALWGGAHAALGEYINAKPNGSGVHLFRAYTLHRRAARALAVAAAEMPEYERQFCLELISKQRDEVLAHLDPVLTDLDQVLTSEWAAEKDPTRKLSAALRIWGGAAPKDAQIRDEEAAVREAMTRRYLLMQDSKRFKSKRALLGEVAAEIGVSLSTASRRWSAYIDRKPPVPSVRWIKEIEYHAKLAKHSAGWARKAAKYQAELQNTQKQESADETVNVPSPAQKCPAKGKREPTKPAYWKAAHFSKRSRNDST